MRLFQSHDLGSEFDKLIQVDLCYFFYPLNFFFSSFTIRLIENYAS